MADCGKPVGTTGYYCNDAPGHAGQCCYRESSGVIDFDPARHRGNSQPEVISQMLLDAGAVLWEKEHEHKRERRQIDMSDAETMAEAKLLKAALHVIIDRYPTEMPGPDTEASMALNTDELEDAAVNYANVFGHNEVRGAKLFVEFLSFVYGETEQVTKDARTRLADFKDLPADKLRQLEVQAYERERR